MYKDNQFYPFSIHITCSFTGLTDEDMIKDKIFVAYMYCPQVFHFATKIIKFKNVLDICCQELHVEIENS